MTGTSGSSSGGTPASVPDGTGAVTASPTTAESDATAAENSPEAAHGPAVARRPRIATVWLGGCSGCHMSFLDLDERLLDLAAATDIVFSPILDIKEFPEDVDVTLVEGAIANEDHLEMIRRVRARTRKLVAMGDCAITGNVTALRNLFGTFEVLQAAYIDRATTQPQIPSEPGIVPALLKRVQPLHHVVTVDAFLPGCPPDAGRIWDALMAVLDGRAIAAQGAPVARFG